ncbi:irregular chiasm C-roughest protein-like isoform X2 [Planococcus citri]|uniref:irregular chiasm C-roughest protein-like isoform X2 n=1 Tax=Planococcus citri TaxID=170843 RepID=UPI0031F749EB
MFKIVLFELCVCVSLAISREGIMSEQRFAIEPQDQTAIVGNRVTLPCRVINRLGTLQWTKDDFALGTHRSLMEFFRYTMIGSDEEGDFSLAIEPVTLDDDARYQCQVSPGPNGEPGIRSRFARLTILVPPEKPRIIQGSSLETTEDSEIKLECVSHGGKPAAEITWIDGLGNVVTKKSPSVDIHYYVEQIPESRLFVAKSILTLRPKKEHHNTTFVCQAQNAADRTYQSTKILLLVKYAPKVTVNIVPDNHMLIEGTDAKLICEADANPPDVTYRWYMNQRPVFPENPVEFVLTNISRKHHDMIVKCEARNLVGKSEDSQTLDVTYGPRFRQKPRSVQADPGTAVNLVCDVDGNPPPDITWIHARDKVVGKSSNLTIVASRETTGRYYCRAHVPGFPDIGAEAYVKMNSKPLIKKDGIQYSMLGDTVRLECSAYSVPMPERTTWSFNGQEIGPNHQDYAVLEDPLPEGVKSTLIIKEARLEHYGTYNCSVTNQYGTDVADITLKLQKSFPLTAVLTAALGGGVLLITLIMIIITCQRKDKKKTIPEMEANNIEKQCKESDKSSNISELKLEMRTGSSASNINCESDYGGGRDSDSIITRVAVPLAGPVPIDQRYSVNRYSSGDFTDPVFQNKDGQNNNGFVPYLEYSRDYTSPLSTTISNGVSPTVTTSSLSTTSLDLRYSATYGNPYLRVNHNNPLPSPPPNPGQPPPPPPYTNIKNGSVPQLALKMPNSNSSQYILANKTQQITTKNTTQATHV